MNTPSGAIEASRGGSETVEIVVFVGFVGFGRGGSAAGGLVRVPAGAELAVVRAGKGAFGQGGGAMGGTAAAAAGK